MVFCKKVTILDEAEPAEYRIMKLELVRSKFHTLNTYLLEYNQHRNKLNKLKINICKEFEFLYKGHSSAS